MKVILLAGGSPKDQIEFDGYKSIIKLKGISMIRYVVDALSSTDDIEEIIIVGNIPDLPSVLDGNTYKLLEEGPTIMDNVLRGLDFAGDEDFILIATCDIPLIKGDIIKGFIEEGIKADVDLFYPIIDKETCINGYPDIKRTFASLREGEFTGGNLILLKPKAISKIERVGRYMIDNRKNPLKMSAFFGLGIITKFLTKTLSIAQLEEYIEDRFDISAKAYHCKNPEICHDLDDPKEIEIFEKYL
ncbi:nucleotidyltransferase family protein [Alkaliphilus serpentinus]|uniref:NTP transferase domain-containing protein n=1 Tax=Alkaliphilus serpentinus TaxID=1482731 RepID=A0A833MAK1_9FIRM|nr:nucleotidyltransferase family protein [Alkaliphilus serpentinus]KAB3532484.1 NTP transferase domain-containing protein [Alkaliphilus serpentinus]